MDIFYHRAPAGNFGDDMNSWVWDEVFPESRDRPADAVLVGIGTILDEGLYTALPGARRFVCFGSGAGYARSLRDMNDAKWLYKVVRGPLSARVLGLDRRHAATDGAILLADLAQYRRGPSRGDETIFVPHHDVCGWPHWEAVCRDAGVTCLSPELDAHVMLDRIRAARLVIADSMHAAICADTFRVPWVAVASSDRISTFKWVDWALSMNLTYRASRLPVRSFHAIVENALLPYQGLRFRLDEPEVDGLLADFAARQREYATPRTAFLHKQAGRLYRRGVSPVVETIDRRLIDNSRRYAALVEAFTTLHAAAGQMSDERVFEQKREQMHAHRDAIARILFAT